MIADWNDSPNYVGFQKPAWSSGECSQVLMFGTSNEFFPHTHILQSKELRCPLSIDKRSKDSSQIRCIRNAEKDLSSPRLNIARSLGGSYVRMRSAHGSRHTERFAFVCVCGCDWERTRESCERSGDLDLGRSLIECAHAYRNIIILSLFSKLSMLRASAAVRCGRLTKHSGSSIGGAGKSERLR